MSTPANRVVRRLIRPVENFMEMESSSGIVLMLATAIALLWANSPFYESYEHLIETPIALSFGSFALSHTFHEWVNDGLMVIFFFVVGLEIKRELLIGELSSPKKAALPMFAALGGMIFPALVYKYFNMSGAGSTGWGIPMATDIAFAVGVLVLMSRKVPFALKVFLLALAIVDDLGAVLIIAFFYTNEIVGAALGTAALCLLLIYVLQYAGVRRHLPYIVLSIIVWFAILKSGVHATVAGVLIGLITPIQSLYPLKDLSEKFKSVTDHFVGELKNLGNSDKTVGGLNRAAAYDLKQMQHFVIEAKSPLERCIYYLHPWVSFVIMPIFAFVNAGVNVQGLDFAQIMNHPITLGVMLGLVLGKPIGVLLLSMLAVRLKMAELPQGVTWFHIVAVGFLAGIGFTMALFISHLALKAPEIEVFSKVGILTASLVAGIIGVTMLFFTKDQPRKNI